MQSVPNVGRKRQFTKNRTIPISFRCRSADILPDGTMRSQTGDVVAAKFVPDGVEHRCNLQATVNVGMGVSVGTVLVKPCCSAHLHERCRAMLLRFGADWCQKARFVNCRLTVADIAVSDNSTAFFKENGTRLSESVQASLEPASGKWMLSVPSWQPLWFAWDAGFIETTVSDHSSGEREHNRAHRPQCQM